MDDATGRIVRDPRLRGLSSDHHHALLLAMRAQRAPGDAVAELWDEVARARACDLEPHFQVEERLLVPALRAAGEVEVAARLLHEHALLRALLSGPGSDALGRLRDLGRLLEAHVRFEERDAFQRAQRLLTPAELDAIGAARPKS